MIIGIGTDVVQIPRIERLLEVSEAWFVEEFFSTAERLQLPAQDASSRARACYLAKRFAAKEAFVKALGTGFSAEFAVRDIGVTNDQHGKPAIVLGQNADRAMLEVVRKLGRTKPRILLSLSDDYPTAVALVVIEAE